MREPRNYDNDRGNRRPRAWFHAKKSFGRQFRIEELMLELERLAGTGCPRLQLAIAMHAYIAMTREQRTAAMMAFYDVGVTVEEAAVKKQETADMEADFASAMTKILGPDWRILEPSGGPEFKDAGQIWVSWRKDGDFGKPRGPYLHCPYCNKAYLDSHACRRHIEKLHLGGETK